MRVKRNHAEKILLRRRWRLWSPIFNGELMEKANQADAESLAGEGDEQLGNFGIIIAIIISIIPVLLVLIGMALETLLQIILFPLAFLLREIKTPWIIEAIDKKRNKYWFWEQKGWGASRKLMKQIAKSYKESPTNPLN